MRTRTTTLILAAAVLTLVACKSKTGKSYPDTTDGLKAMINDIAEASESDAKTIAKRLAPDDAEALYARFFDAAVAKTLAAEIKPQLEKIETLALAVKGNKSKGKTEISVESFIDEKDEAMTGLQKLALTAMTNKTPLYSVRMVEPGKDSGFHLWSFVHVDGKFRYVGKMKSVAPPGGSRELQMLGELRIQTAKEILAGKK